MKTVTRYLAFTSAVALFASMLAGPGFAQAYVNQASPHGPASSVYLEQVSPRARMKAPAAPTRKRSPPQAVATDAAVVVRSAEPFTKPRYPDVGSGSSAIVQSNTSEWPTVGRGAVNR